MILGYARISAADQNLALQLDALRAAGCDRIFQEVESGARSDRPVLAELMSQVQTGDQVISWRFDRMGRDAWHLLGLVRDLETKGASYRSLTEGLDSSTSFGAFGLQILAAVAQMERNTIRERQRAGMEAARRAGRPHGRPQALPPQTIALAQRMISEGGSINAAAKALRVARATLQRALKAMPN